jgi:hypothetical protein
MSLTYHSPITIEFLTYRVLLGTLKYSSSGWRTCRLGQNDSRVYKGLLNRCTSV